MGSHYVSVIYHTLHGCFRPLVKFLLILVQGMCFCGYSLGELSMPCPWRFFMCSQVRAFLSCIRKAPVTWKSPGLLKGNPGIFPRDLMASWQKTGGKPQTSCFFSMWILLHRFPSCPSCLWSARIQIKSETEGWSQFLQRTLFNHT